jgi:hypothetical protein
MKRTLKFIAFAVATTALVFTSCKGKEDDPEILLDGFYLLGEATEFSKPTANAMFFGGRNEEGQALDPRIKEKYVHLEGGKTFYIAEVAAGKEVGKIGGTATNFEYPGQDRTEGGGNEAWGAKYYRPLTDGTFTAPSTGLYHVVYFTGDEAADFLPIVMVVKTDWGFRGDLNDWGFTKATATKVADGYNFEWTGDYKGEKFKLTYNGGWKLPLVFDEEGDIEWGTVLVNTNLGGTMPNNLSPGGADMFPEVFPGEYKITFQWRTSGNHGFSNLILTPINVQTPEDPGWEDLEIVGSAVGSWDDGFQLARGTNTGTTYTWTGTAVELAADGEDGWGFKIRTLGTWEGRTNLGWDNVTIAGNDIANFYKRGDNIGVTAAGTYNVTVTLDWMKVGKTRWTITLNK